MKYITQSALPIDELIDKQIEICNFCIRNNK